MSTATANNPSRWQRFKERYIDDTDIEWYNMSWSQKAVHLTKQFGYTFVVLAGAGVIGTTIYEVYVETKRAKIVNDIYDKSLARVQRDDRVSAVLRDPIKGQYEMEWRTREGRHLVSQESVHDDGRRKMMVQFNVYGSEQKGTITTEWLETKTTETIPDSQEQMEHVTWDEYFTFLFIPATNSTIVLRDDRPRQKEWSSKERKGWFGWNRAFHLKRPSSNL